MERPTSAGVAADIARTAAEEAKIIERHHSIRAMTTNPKCSRRGLFAFLVALPLAVSMSVSGCSGDDTILLPAFDATTYADITTVDVGDAGADASTCAIDAGPYDDAAVQLGISLVTSHNCYQCHGQSLSGNNDGVPSATAEGGVAYPPNLTPDPVTGLGCWTSAQIQNAILNGIDNEGQQLCAPMPLFGDLDGAAGLTPDEAQAVISYLRTLNTVSNQVEYTPQCLVPDAGVLNDGATDASEAADANDGG